MARLPSLKKLTDSQVEKPERVLHMMQKTFNRHQVLCSRCRHAMLACLLHVLPGG